MLQVGFHPDIPHWWNSRWNVWFGGEVWNEDGEITIDSDANVACYEWLRSMYEEYGIIEMDRLRAASDNFDSPQWPFFSERVAMVIQGVWTPNFIDRHAPDLEWGAAPVPTYTEELYGTTLVSNDILVIPRGCPNLEGAWDFLKYVQKQENIEKLNLLQKKFSPLREVNDSFYEEHTNKEIKLFRQLAESPNALIAPKFASFWELQAELNDVFYQVKKGEREPREILESIKGDVKKIFDKASERWQRVVDERRRIWSEWQ